MTKVNCTVDCVFQEGGLCSLEEIQVVQDQDRAECASCISPATDDDETTMMLRRRRRHPERVYPFWV